MQHRVCLGKEIGPDQADIRIFEVLDAGNGYGQLVCSYGTIDEEKTKEQSPLMAMSDAIGVFEMSVQALREQGFFEIDENDYASTPALSQELHTGTRFLDRYWIRGLLGSGGQGRVYLAADTWMEGRSVALKVLKHQGLSAVEQEEAERRFRQEMALLAQLGLKHQAIPLIYNVEVIDGMPVMAMQYIEGESLQQKLDKVSPCPLPVACEIVLQLCDVLDFLHNQTPPIVYRDLKPSNVMIDSGWQQLYLIDFGIARFFDGRKKHDTVAMGSPGYISPELLAGRQTTPRSDIYSLGALFHYLVTGEDPGDGDLFTFSSTRGRFPDVGRTLDPIIGKMTEKDMTRRYSSMQEVAKAIEGFKKRSNTKTVKAEEPLPLPAPKKPAKGTVFVLSTSLLLDDCAEDKASAQELYYALSRPLRTNGYVIWGNKLLRRAETPAEKQEQLKAQMEEATHLILAITPDLLQTKEGDWIIKASFRSKKPVSCIPMRECQGLSAQIRLNMIGHAWINTAPSAAERKKRLEKIVAAFLQKIEQKEKVA